MIWTGPTSVCHLAAIWSKRPTDKTNRDVTSTCGTHDIMNDSPFNSGTARTNKEITSCDQPRERLTKT